jgi:hypothetical protein
MRPEEFWGKNMELEKAKVIAEEMRTLPESNK